MTENALDSTKAYFNSHKWNSMDISGKTIFYKSRDPNLVKKHEFLGYSKKKGHVSATDITGQIEEVFIDKGFNKAPSQDIVRPNGSSTFFITSGIQAYEKQIFAETFDGLKDTLFIQPVIRTNYSSNIGEGNISSFVNPSTVRFNCGIDTYLKDLDSWMNLLSKTGLYLGDVIFTLNPKKTDSDVSNPWNRIGGFTINCSYGGLGLGSAGYLQTPDNKLNFEDIGFGLERVLWAVNKTESFKDVIGVFPYAFNQDVKTIDTLRTLSLMSMFDIETNQDAFNQFKKYLGSKPPMISDTEHQIRKYQESWNAFVTPAKSGEESLKYVMEKINAIDNTQILSRLNISKVPAGLKSSILKDKDTFIRELLKINPEKLTDIKELYKTV